MIEKNSSSRLTTVVLMAAGACTIFGAPTASADVVSDAAKIGANAGAMKYCRDNIADDGDKSKYKLLALESAKEYDNLSSGDKVKALVYRRAAEDGDYLGDPLTKARCDSIRKLLFIKYK